MQTNATLSTVRDSLIGALRVTLAPTPTGYRVASQRSDAPATRTAQDFAGWTTAAARFDELVAAAATVQEEDPQGADDDTIMCAYCDGTGASGDGRRDCPRCAGRGYAVRS